MTEDLDQLKQFVDGIIWDGHVISKSDRDELVKEGYVKRYEGFNFLTEKGVKFLIDKGFGKR